MIFCLRQRNAGRIAVRSQATSPRHSCCCVYIQSNRNIRYGCVNLQQILAVFEMAGGRTAPLAEFCDRFDQETHQGRNMALCDRLLTDAIAHVVQAPASISFTDSWLQGNPDLLFVHLSAIVKA